MEWVLIIMMHVGALGSGNSNALTNAYFSTQELCEEARKEISKLTSNTVKEIRTVCVRGKK